MQKILSGMLLSTLLLLSGCLGGSGYKVVSDLNYDVRDNDQYEKMAHVDFVLSLGSAELPVASYQLPNNLGELSLMYGEGKNVASIDINLTEALKLPAGEATLPNGGRLPLYSSTGVIQIDIEKINASVYLAHNGDQTVIGFAIAIKQLDRVGSELGSVGLFPSFTVKEVRITAGIFSGNDSGNTGVAAFANLKGLLDEESEPGKLFFYKYKYSKSFLRKVQRVINEYNLEKRRVLTPVLR